MTRAETLSMEFHDGLWRVITADMGLSEIAGAMDHLKIETAHQITKIEGIEGKPSTDEIPWCASMMNLWVLTAAAQMNPGAVIAMMQKRKLDDSLILKVLFHAGLEPRLSYLDNKTPVPAPTWTAWALDWAEWGSPVPKDQRRLGHVWAGKRDGGGHVSGFNKDQLTSVLLRGGNQSNMVCDSSYLKTREVSLRRFWPAV